MIAEFWDAVAVGSDHNLYVFFTDKRQPPCCVQLPPLPVSFFKYTHQLEDSPLKYSPQDNVKRLEADKMCVAWALSYTAIAEPLVIFSCGSLLYIYNIRRRGISSYLRGHGGVRISVSGVDSCKIKKTQTNLGHHIDIRSPINGKLVLYDFSRSYHKNL